MCDPYNGSLILSNTTRLNNMVNSFNVAEDNEDPLGVLQKLKLPSRYESLVAAVGPKVAQLLIEPSGDTLDIFSRAASHIQVQGSGLFLPVFADPGTGKTTLISSLGSWISGSYGPTVKLANEESKEITFEKLRKKVADAVSENDIPSNDHRILVINIDGRESDGPSSGELSEIKMFLREPGAEYGKPGSRILLVWLTTKEALSREMSKEYENVAGSSPVNIPVQVKGPDPGAWQQIASNTLELVNDFSGLDELGVNPCDYEPAEYNSIGDFLQKISSDFVELKHRMLSSMSVRVKIVFVFACESSKADVLRELVGNHHDMLDPIKLLKATPDSEIGEYWKKNRGLLTTTVLKLEARATFVTPALSVPILYQHGPNDVRAVLGAEGYKDASMKISDNTLKKSHFYKVLAGELATIPDGRGSSFGGAKLEAFRSIAKKYKFTAGRDKKLNRAFGEFLKTNPFSDGVVSVEERLQGTKLIPDISLKCEGHVKCIEFHWRGKDLLKSDKSAVAQYILKKLRAYAEALDLGAS